MKQMKWTDIAILVLSAVLCAGTKLVFHACGPKEDGSWMNCHWAEQAVFLIGLALVAAAVLRLFVNGQMRRGMSLAMIPAAAAAAVLPQNFVHLCMMNEMRCHAVMRPAVIIVSVLLVIFAVIDIILRKEEMHDAQ